MTKHDETGDRSKMDTGALTVPAIEGREHGGAVQRRAAHLRLGRRLGAGGMAEVYEAQDDRLERTVAVKFMHAELSTNEEARSRFQEEARVLGQLDHPGTVPVFLDGQLEDGRPFYAMRRIQGHTLKELLKARSPEEVRDRSRTAHFVDLFERVCQTMAVAHAEGILHRDLKPENVMVDQYSSVFVVDWGLAKRMAPKDDAPGVTRHGQVMGTPSYMAPELAAGNAFHSEAQADVFSLGAILYEILTGEQAFRGRTGREVMTQVLHQRPAPPQRLNPRASRTLGAICMKALEKDPYRRYPTARELAADIRRNREHLPVSAIRPSLAERLYNWSRRRPRLAAVVGTAAILGLLAGVAIAFKASFEAHVVGEVKKSMAAVEAGIRRTEHEIAGLRERVAAAPEGSVERQYLEDDLAGLEAIRRFDRTQLEWHLWAIMGFTQFVPDRDVARKARQLMLEGVEEAVERGDLATATAVLETARRSMESNKLLDWTEDDRIWVTNRRADVDQLKIERRRQQAAEAESPAVVPGAGQPAPRETSSSRSSGSGT